MIRLSDELARRGNRRDGLADVMLRHEPTNTDFACQGSSWNASSKLEVRTESGDRHLADECLLIGPWPLPRGVRRAKKGKKQDIKTVIDL